MSWWLLVLACRNDTDAPTDDTDTDTDTPTSTADTGAVEDVDGDGVPAPDDCDDADEDRFPGNPEVCDGVDQDCDDEVDDGVLSSFFADEDLDGAGSEVELLTCACGEGCATDGGDCDDLDPAVFPGAPEACDGVDSDCARDEDRRLITVVGGATFRDLSVAVGAAAPGDVLEICPGTYPSAVTVGADLTLRGRGDRIDVVLEGDPSAPVVTVSGGALVLEHLTIRGGGNPTVPGGGVSAVNAASVAVDDVVFTGNTGSQGGALRGPDHGTLTVDRSVFALNHGGVGGAVYAVGGAVRDSVVEENDADSGAGVYAITGGGGLDLTGTVLQANTAIGCGGGLGLGGAIDVVGGTITANSATCGGGVYAPDLVGELVDLVITDNQAPGFASYGGGLFFDSDSGPITLRRCDIRGNGTRGYGGGVYAVDTDLVLIEGAVAGNTDPFAGGVLLDGASTLVVVDADFGAGGQDNSPYDVSVGGVGFDGYGAAASFSCGPGGCTP